MAYEVTLPRLGWDMEEGALGGWLKNDGDFVNSGEMLFTVEGDKAVQEIEALDSGVLRISPDAPAVGRKVPVGALLGYLVPKDELAAFDAAAAARTSAPAAVTEAAPTPTLTAASQAESGSTTPAPNGRDGRRIYISPYARRMAEGAGIDWRSVAGSGRAGRIMASDIQSALALQKAPPAQAAPLAPAPQPPIPTRTAAPAVPMVTSPAANRTPMPATRRSIAEHMAASARTAAPVTLTCEVDATQMVLLRRQLKDDLQGESDPAPTYNDMLAKLCARALLEHPDLNARIDGDDIVTFASAHVGIAVDTDRGLVVPVLRDVQAKSLRQLARESTVLIEKARQGTAAYDDYQGGTFTITNLGMYEIEAFTPIINLPQCAILGVGQIVPKLVVIDAEQEKTAIQQRMVLSLTFDHRLVDGAQAARFLQRIKRLVEKPFLWLAG